MSTLRVFVSSSLLTAGLLTAQTLNIPLTLEEPAGVKRVAEPVTAGIPLPKGLVRDRATLRLYGPDGKMRPAYFRPVNRWWSDASTQLPSIQWVHVDFFADVEANQKAVYRVGFAGVEPPAPAAALRVEPGKDDIQVDTGALKFTVHRTGPFLSAPGLRAADFLLRSDERIYKASQWPQSELVVEDQNPLRVVLKRTGSHGWVDRRDRALDYVLRVIAYAGRPHIRIVYSFVNRQGERMSDFVRLDGLWLQAQLERQATPASIEQLGAEPRRTGWFQAGGVGAGLRWFWQLYPYAAAPPKWYTRDTHALGRLVESSAEAIVPEYWPLVQRFDRWLVACREAVLAKRDRGFVFGNRRFDEYGMLNFGDALHKLGPNDSQPDYGIHWDTEYYDFPHALFLHFFRTGDMKSFRTAIEAAAHLADVDISHYEVETGFDGASRTGPGLNHWTRYSNGIFISAMSWAFYKNESLFDRWLLTGDLWSRDAARLSADWGVNFNGLDLPSNTRSIGHGLFAMLKAHEVFGDKKYLDRANWIIDSLHAWQDADVEKLRVLNPRAVWDPQYKGGYSFGAWTYGIALEAVAQASLALGRPEMPGYMRRAADWIFANPKEWDAERRIFLNAPVHAVMLTPGLSYIGETSGQRKYWDVALESFRYQTGQGQLTDQLKLFAQLFRNSQRFPWYLSVESPIRWREETSGRPSGQAVVRIGKGTEP